MTCKFYAPDKTRSKLYDDLVNKYGEVIGTNTWTFLQNRELLEGYNLPVNKRGEFELVDIEANNLIIDYNLLETKRIKAQNFKYKSEQLSKAFKGIDIETRENKQLDSSAVVLNENGKPVIEYNPDRVREDSAYHEHGHILIDLVGYDSFEVQSAIAELRGGQLYNTIMALNPWMSSEQLEKETLATEIGKRAALEDGNKLKFYINRLLRKLGEVLGIKMDAVDKLVDQLVSKNITSKLDGKLSLYAQHQRDFRIMDSVFVNKKEVLEKAIIGLELKIRDYFSNLTPDERYSNPMFRDYKTLSTILQEYKEKDITKGIVEFLSFAYVQTQALEKRIDSITNPDRLSERPEITSAFLKDLLNYNESFGDIMEDLEAVINSDYLLKQELKNYKARYDSDILAYIPAIKERYHKVKRAGKMLSLEYVADRMMNTGENNKFVEHLKNKLKRQWLELGNNMQLMKDNPKEARKLQDAWAEDEIQKLKDWKYEGESEQDGTIVSYPGRTMLQELTRKYYLGLLQQSTNDVAWLERMFLAGNMINDEFIQFGNELLDKADFKTRVALTAEYRAVMDLFDRFSKENPSSNQQEKYKHLIEKEVQLNEDGSLSFTGKNSQYMVSKYYAKFFEYKNAKYKAYAEAKEQFGENSPEAEEKYKEYQQFLDDNTVREFSDEYYEAFNSLSDTAAKAVKPLKKRRKAILSRYAVNSKNNVYNITDITEDDAEELANIDREIKYMSAMYDKQGNKKTGKALQIAEELTEYNKRISKMHTEGKFQQELFDKAKEKAKKRGKLKEFMDKNTYIGIKQEFWDQLEVVFSGPDTNEELRKQIKGILKNFKNEKNEIIVDELDEQVVALLKELYTSMEKSNMKSRAWFNKNVEFVPTKEYKAKKKEMEELLANEEITLEEFDTWDKNNHIISYTKSGEEIKRPLPFWTEIRPKNKKYFETKYHKYWYTSDVKDEYKNKNIQPGEEVGGLKNKWLNPQYNQLSGVNKEMYDYLTNKLEEDDKPLYYDYRSVTMDDIGNKYYKLPSVIKHTDTEILGDDGLSGVFRNKWNRIKAAFEGKAEDNPDFGGDVLTALYEESNNILLIQADEQGRERHRVPVNLRTPISQEDQSYDLLSVILLNHHMSLNFVNKQEIAHDLELMRDLLEERNVVETQNTAFKGVKQKVNNIFGLVGLGIVPKTNKGVDSNAYKAFASMLEARLYGIKNRGSVQAHQIASVLTKYTGTTALALNIYSAGSNLVSGRLQNYILASGNQFIDFKDIGFARLEINKQALDLITDVSKRAPVSKIGRLLEKLNVKADWVPLSKKFSMDTDLKRIYERIDLDILNSTGEVLIQSTLMLSVLNSAKALSKNGKFLNREFEETDNEGEAISMYDVYNNDKLEMIKVDERVGGFDIRGKKFQDKDFEFYLSFFIRELNKSLQGDYDANNPSEARRTVIGKLALVLRRWYPATLMRRVRGISSVGKNSAELDEEEVHYNRATREIEEGYHTTFLRFMYQSYKEFKRLKFEEGRASGAAILEGFSNTKTRMLRYERANLYQIGGELIATFGYLALSTLLYTLGRKIDDENEKSKFTVYILAYWILKAQRELMSYYNPNEMLKTLSSPSVVLKQMKEMMDVIFALGAEVGHQFDEPFSLRRYERGRRKGQSKTYKEITDIVPILKQLNKAVEEQLSYMTNVRGF